MQQITFEKSAAPFILRAVDIKPSEMKCHFCKQSVSEHNLGGIIGIDGEPVLIHNWLPCLIQLSQYLNDIKKNYGINK